MEIADEESQDQINRLQASNQDWDMNTKQLFKQIQQNEIIQEKKDYDRAARMDEMAMLMRT